MPKNPLTFLPGYTEPTRKRLPGDFIDVVFDSGTRERLSEDLARILSGTTDEQRAMFLKAAELAIDWYHKIDKPFVADQEELPKQLDRLEKAMREAHEAAYAVGPVAASLIAQKQSRVLMDGGATEGVEFEETLVVADWAKFTSDAIMEIRGGGWRTRTGQTGAALSSLIERMALAYASVFGEQPSAARQGHFMKVTVAVLEAANLPLLGEKPIRRILEEVRPPAPRPRRGPKPKMPR